MKKITVFALFIAIFTSSTTGFCLFSAESEPKNLGSGIRLYQNTVKKKFFERTAVFKVDYPDTEKIDDVKVAYETVHVKANCRKKILEFEYFSYFDAEDNWLYGYKNQNPAGVAYNAYNNGKVFFKALCGNKA